jgi:hypothetical protein
MTKTRGGKQMTTEEIDQINLECDLMNLVNRYAWPQSTKIVREILSHYHVEPKSKLPRSRDISLRERGGP